MEQQHKEVKEVIVSGQAEVTNLTQAIEAIEDVKHYRRMTQQLRTLYKIGLALKPCPKCGQLRHAFIAGKGKESVAKEENKGRLFQKCTRVNARGLGLHGCENSFEWLVIKE